MVLARLWSLSSRKESDPRRGAERPLVKAASIAKGEVSRCGATYFALGGKVGKTPPEPTVQDSLGNVGDFIESRLSFDDSERCLPGVVRRAQRAACSAAQAFRVLRHACDGAFAMLRS